jgi:hypothetical protein
MLRKNVYHTESTEEVLERQKQGSKLPEYDQYNKYEEEPDYLGDLISLEIETAIQKALQKSESGL